MAVALLLVACGGGQETKQTIEISPTVHVFKADQGGWKPNNGRWYSYAVSEEPCDLGVWFPINPVSLPSCFRWLTGPEGAASGWVTSTGPWWTDQNHMQLPGGDGFGFVNVIAFTRLPAGYRTPANLDNAVVTFTARTGPDFSTLFAPSREGYRQGHMYLWFQTAPRTISPCTPDPSVGEDCTRQSDYILTGGWDESFELDRGSGTDEGRTFSFRLSAGDTDRWTCLGRGVNVKYDCMGLESAIKQVEVIGFLLAPVAPCPTVGAAAGDLCDSALIASHPDSYLNLGSFSVRHFDIVKERRRPAQASLVAFSPSPRRDPRSLWHAPGYSAAVVQRPGRGLTMPLGQSSLPMRLGIGSERVSDLDKAGLQVYVLPAGTDLSVSNNTLMVVDRSNDGRYTRAVQIGTYSSGDSVSLHFEDESVLVLKNDEVAYQFSLPCNAPEGCDVYPFYSSRGNTSVPPAVYVY